ncbi:hypothetical protein BDZ91DRAFT_691621 [Kalaharituber pfeilii]|nr:hypothetical protein BDZ91DRAFT_691621 [Kalaharituber pfeilii]
MKPAKISASPPSPQWVIDISNIPNVSRPTSQSRIPDPPGFGGNSNAGGGKQKAPPAKPPPSQSETDTLFLKKSWELALSPTKSLPMNFIMMYMSGNTLQIFSIMMVWMLFTNPLKAIANVNATFRRFDNERTHARLLTVKMVYVALQVLALGLGVWKVNGMGLLPNRRSDWLAWEKVRLPLEQVGVGQFFDASGGGSAR